MRNKMNATMSDMELIEADKLAPDQLMIGDLIKVNNDILEVTFIESDSTGDNYDIQVKNEFDELEIIQFAYTDSIPLYVFIDYDE
jgi:regulatory protein YycH of two-component signal transduction system YycFG